MLLILRLSEILPDTEHLGTMLIRIALTVAVAFVLQRIGFLLVWRAERWLVRAARQGEHGAVAQEHAVQRARTLSQTARHLITTLVTVGTILHGLEIIGWDVKPFLVGASILGAALAFGAQTLVRDLIAGVFILLEDQFAVGDRVEVNGRVAVVEGVTLRSTRLRDIDGRMLFVPNGEMKIVVNHSRGWNLAAVEIPLAPNQDLDRALSVARELVDQINLEPLSRARMVEPMVVQGFDRIGAEGAVLRLTARALPGAEAVALTRDVRLRALQRLSEAGLRASSSSHISIVQHPAAAGLPAAGTPEQP